MSKEIDARLFAHPYVRSNGPSLRPDHLPWRMGAGGGQGWPKGHRVAAPSVLEDHPPPCDAGDRRALDPTSPSHHPLEASGSGSGKPIKKRDGDPINYRAPAQMLMSWVPSIHGVTDLTILVSAKAAALQWPT